jgi:hypothetical protein
MDAVLGRYDAATPDSACIIKYDYRVIADGHDWHVEPNIVIQPDVITDLDIRRNRAAQLA